MELLNELIYILKRNYLHPAEDILPLKSKSWELFNLVSSGDVQTDEEAARIIFNGSGKEGKYEKLKKNLVKTLLELVLNANVADPQYIYYQKFLFNGRKELMIAEKLLNQNVYHNAEKIILKVKAYAERFQMLELRVDCIKHLRTVYTLKGYPKEVELYSALIKRLNTLIQYEQEAVGYIDLLDSKIKYSIGKYKEIAAEAKTFSLHIREWQKESNSVVLKLYQYKIDLIRCYHVNDSREWLVILNRLTELLNSYPYLRTPALTLYIYVEWAKYLRGKANITKARVYIERALQISDYEAFNKFEVQALNFDIKLKEKKYEGAGKVSEEVKRCPQYTLLEGPDKAAWLLREAYLYFIFSSLGERENIERYAPSFVSGISIPELVDACAAISKDKKGYNFMLVVLKECLFMQGSLSSEVENRSNNLLVYFQRYLKDLCENRTKIFTKKVAKAVRAGFSADNKGTSAHDENQLPLQFDAAELIQYENFSYLLAHRRYRALLQG